MKILKQYLNARTGILTNHTGFGWKGDYHFRSLQKYLDVVRIFIPEHGLFAELQDQVSGKELEYFHSDTEFWNLYGDTEESLVPPSEKLTDLDLVVVDIRDVGARYYTFLTTAYYILQKISLLKKSGNSVPSILVVDSPNPIGRKVEGTPLQMGYSSFVGVEGVIHRHGLSPGELLTFYNIERNLELNLRVLPVGKLHPKKYDEFTWIPPSPNIPAQTTCYVYSGQCLLEGTNVSEGRGTTRPFEIFGAPFVDYQDLRLLSELESVGNGSFYLRPLRFVPTFHKHRGEICGGYQLHIRNKEKFHSLLFSLHLIKVLKVWYPDHFQYLDGVYEFRSDRPAIELLVGDPILLDYLEGGMTQWDVHGYIAESQHNWIKKITSMSICRNLRS